MGYSFISLDEFRQRYQQIWPEYMGYSDVLSEGAYLYEGYEQCLCVEGNLRIKGNLYLDDMWDSGDNATEDTWDAWEGAMSQDEDGYWVIPCALVLERVVAGLLVTGDLTVEGDVVNRNGDWGVMLYVCGTLRAKSLNAGGAHMLATNIEIEQEVAGFANNGSLVADKLSCRYLISNDHDILVLKGFRAEAYYWPDRDLFAPDSVKGAAVEAGYQRMSDSGEGDMSGEEMDEYLKGIGVDKEKQRWSHYYSLCIDED